MIVFSELLQMDFNPRTPRGVRHIIAILLSGSMDDFNPRTPRGVRRLGFQGVSVCLVISIHAPREGCDSSRATKIPLTSIFQSTHPARGATFGNFNTSLY